MIDFMCTIVRVIKSWWVGHATHIEKRNRIVCSEKPKQTTWETYMVITLMVHKNTDFPRKTLHHGVRYISNELCHQVPIGRVCHVTSNRQWYAEGWQVSVSCITYKYEEQSTKRNLKLKSKHVINFTPVYQYYVGCCPLYKGCGSWTYIFRWLVTVTLTDFYYLKISSDGWVQNLGPFEYYASIQNKKKDKTSISITTNHLKVVEQPTPKMSYN